MTDKRALAAAITRAIFDHIERDRTLIMQNIEETVHDALLLDGAKQRGNPIEPEPSKFVKFLAPKRPWWQIEPGPEAGE